MEETLLRQRRQRRRCHAASTAPSLLLWPSLLLALALALSGVAAYTPEYTRDELLWMKAHWQDWKLTFPWSAALRQRDGEGQRQLQGPLARFAANSMNGPLLDAANIAARVQEDAARASQQQSSLDLTLLDEEASQELAASVAQCKVCGSLVKLLWAGLTRWVNRHDALPSRQRVLSYAQDLCEFEVPNDVLKQWVVLRARMQQGQGAPFLYEGTGQEFYMLSKRVKQHATPPEIDAVRKACRNLLSADEKDTHRQLVHQTAALLGKYVVHLRKRAAGGGVGGADGGVIEIVPVDNGPVVERVCFNRHPQCEAWVKKGECESNRQYMFGPEGQEEDGWCRRACGACQAAELPGSTDADQRTAKAMQEVHASLLALLQINVCIGAAACKWAVGAGTDRLLAKAKQGADREAARLMESAEFISGPISTERQQLEAALDQNRLKESRPALLRALNDGLVPRKAGGKLSEEPPEKLRAEAAQAVWAELGAKCIYVTTGWWWYEVCPFSHIDQFHMKEQEVDWVISLGRWQASNWTLQATALAGIYPHFTKVPFVAQAFANGNHCDRDPDPATGATRPPVARTTELRFLCSPDAEYHLTVAEPDQCSYVVELYLPTLCALPGFAVEAPPGGWLAASHDDTDSTRGAGMGDLGPQYALPQDLGEDDPYADPDDDAAGHGEL